ncbi:lycopene cyclase domain-containing protein [Mucilaginibacter sp. HMF5004]|uniref:lycopene cyclase domain-containing protein n=1 Tax=Mucilaginibacter rivuli TaxID=2857527 RepID=UPI001C5FF6A9|nr:lycopene cyclase domain-containing protein [Mucilaginibacter rivuli]MBW4891784.1 lycopene cyclase domain-containing protein [Mucilaginibacter rivuli]
MKYTYLLINFLTILFPLLLSFDKRVAFYKCWKFIWPGMAITGLFFLVWDVFFTMQGVWSFNDDYILGIKIFQLPLEEVLFFLTVPFACIFIYACLNRYVKWELPAAVADTITTAVIVYALLNCSFNYNKLYTFVTLALTFFALVLVRFVFKAPWLNRFYVAYAVCLLPFYLVNGYLTSIPIVMYNNAQNLHSRVATIPLEDHFYLLVLLLMNIAFFEYFKKRSLVH